MQFSKFGVWDDEVKTFINKLCGETKISEKALTDWLYSEGILLFQKQQSTNYDSDVKFCQNTYKHKPMISFSYMLGQKFIGFMAMLPKLIEKFVTDDATSKKVSAIFNEFVTNAVNNHQAFYHIQAEITTSLHQWLDKNPNSSNNDTIYQYSNDKLVEYKNKQPELAQELDDHLQLISEFAKYRREQQKITTPSKPLSSPKMFSATSPMQMQEWVSDNRLQRQ